MEFVTPSIEQGGCDVVYVMPNLQPPEGPITQVSQATVYHEKLSRIAPRVQFLMSLYLHPNVTTGEHFCVCCARERVVLH